jgi:hypothetical protein
MGDLIQNNKRLQGGLFTNLVFKMLGVSYPGGGVAWDLRVSSSKVKTKASIDKILSWDFDKLIIAHGPCVMNDAKEYIKQAFSWAGPQ